MPLKWLDFTVLPLVVQFYSDTFGFATFCCEVVCLWCVCVCGAHMFGVQRLILGEIPQELPILFFFFFDKRFCHWYLGCHWLAGLAGQWTSWILLFLLLRLQTHATMPFSVSSDDQTQVLMFIQQSLYWVSIPSTTLLFMYCKYFLHSEFPFLFFPFLLKRILCFNINFHICNCRFG